MPRSNPTTTGARPLAIAHSFSGDNAGRTGYLPPPNNNHIVNYGASSSSGAAAWSSGAASSAAATTTSSPLVASLAAQYGASLAGMLPPVPPATGVITLNVSTTTGSSYTVEVDSGYTVATLKKIIAKKLKLSKERICLLHRER